MVIAGWFPAARFVTLRAVAGEVVGGTFGFVAAGAGGDTGRCVVEGGGQPAAGLMAEGAIAGIMTGGALGFVAAGAGGRGGVVETGWFPACGGVAE